MKSLNEIILDLMKDESVANFEIKSIKNGLIVVKSHFLPMGVKIEIHPIDDDGAKLLNRINNLDSNNRNEMITVMHKQGYTQTELALLFTMTQSSISKILKEKKELQ